MQKITTFLTFDHQAEQALELYTSAFPSSKVIATTRYPEGTPMPAGQLMTAELELFGQQFILLNGGPSFTFTQGFSLVVNCETQDEIDTYTEKLTAGGGALVACGWIRDRFGVSWQITPIQLGQMLKDKDAARAGRVMLAMMTMTKLDLAALKAAYDG